MHYESDQQCTELHSLQWGLDQALYDDHIEPAPTKNLHSCLTLHVSSPIGHNGTTHVC